MDMNRGGGEERVRRWEEGLLGKAQAQQEKYFEGREREGSVLQGAGPTDDDAEQLPPPFTPPPATHK